MRKVFNKKEYPGRVVSIDKEDDDEAKILYHVEFDDGDEADFYEEELRPLLYDTKEMDVKISASQYIARRERAINLFKHYPVHKHMHTHTLTNTHTPTNTHIHTQTETCIFTYFAHPHTHTHTHTHTLTHFHAYTHTHTQSHTHTPHHRYSISE